MTDPSVSEAIEAWRRDLGVDAVEGDAEVLRQYARSCCGTEREIIAVLKPRSTDEVQRIVETANRFKTALYPVSCGKQWGMGSKLPVQEAAAIVDLSGMNRIHEVNGQYGYAVVEPGVTQGQLLDYIKSRRLRLMLNVTGSTSDTSLIGNALDRGVGYFDSRVGEISNMEIVLGNGRCIRTGFGHFDGVQTGNLYPHGVGPSLDGIFTQGNFGIVTSACIDLMPVQDQHMAVMIKIKSEAQLPRLIDALVDLRSRNVITTVAHIGNRERSYMTMAPLLYEQLLKKGSEPGASTRQEAEQMLERAGFGPWSASIGVLGSKAQLQLAKREIRKTVGRFAKVMFLSDLLVDRARTACRSLKFIPFFQEQLMLLNAVEPLYALTRGEATDETIKALYWAADDLDSLNNPDPDKSNSGILFCLPIIPADGEVVRDVIDHTVQVFAKYGFRAAVTVNLISPKAFEGVISLSFNRNDEERGRKAHVCIQEIEAWYMSQGYPPYRVGINSMHQVLDENDAYWQTVRDLKQSLDPNEIIAPGRYNLI